MDDFKICGQVADAPFTLTLHRGEGMCLLAMNWRDEARPPDDFVGFMIEFREPGSDQWWTLNNRLSFTDASTIADKSELSTKLSPIQKFRWVHFPFAASLAGIYSYRVTPVFMSPAGDLSYGTAQTADVVLKRETYPGELDVGFTRGFISSQAFVDNFGSSSGSVDSLIPPGATSGDTGLTFHSTDPKAATAYPWMGFEARQAILGLLDAAIADPTAQVRVVAYDFDLSEVYDRVVQLAGRIRIVIDDSGAHKPVGSAESTAEVLLKAKLGADNVLREHCGGLQHNKFIVATGNVNKAVCGSTNFSWRGFYVQNNNAITISGADAIQPFWQAFDAYWAALDTAANFETAGLGKWIKLPLAGVDAELCFSPHAGDTARLKELADDIGTKTTSSLLYSLAFLYQTPGPILDAITGVTDAKDRFVYGISDRAIKGGLEVTTPDGNTKPVYPSALSKNVPPPFKAEPTGGSGVRMHHKFVVIDFDQPTARVYVGSYNFSSAADTANGENLMVIRDRVATTAFMVEALAMFDHYQFRVAADAATDEQPLVLKKPPAAGEKPWFDEDYTVPYKVRDRMIFSG